MQKTISMATVLSLVMVLLGSVNTLKAQEKSAALDTLMVHTSAVCHMCKDRIEKELGYTRGVKSVNLDLGSNNVTIVYKTDKTDADALKEALTKIGYDADEIPAKPKAKARLHECCKAPDDHH